MGIPNSFSNVPLPLSGRAIDAGGIPVEDIRTALEEWGIGEKFVS